MPDTEIVEYKVSTFDWAITAKKFIYGFLFTMAPILLAYSINFLNMKEFPPEVAIYIPIIVGSLQSIQNYASHKNDSQTIKIDKATGRVIPS